MIDYLGMCGEEPIMDQCDCISTIEKCGDLVDGFGGGALVFSDNFPAISGDFVGVGRLKKAFLYRPKQILFVFYHNSAVIG